MVSTISLDGMAINNMAQHIRLFGNFIRKADGLQVRTYVWLLSRAFDDELIPTLLICKELACTENELAACLRYWETEQLIEVKDDDVVLEVKLLPCSTQRGAASDSGRRYKDGVLETFVTSKDGAPVVAMLKAVVKHQLSMDEIDMVYFFIDKFGFSPALLLHMARVCMARGIGSITKMEECAVEWYSAGIKTVEDAKKYGRPIEERLYSSLVVLGIENPDELTARQADFLKKWLYTDGFSERMIEEACRRTVNVKKTADFDYINSIIMNWYAKGIRDTDELQKADQEFYVASAKKSSEKKNSFVNFPQRKYDYDKLEQELLNNRK